MTWSGAYRSHSVASAALRVARSNFVRSAPPWKLSVALTYWCQYRCVTCNIWRKQPSDELDLAEIKTFIDQNAGFSWVDLTGGEIFLRKDLEEILLHLTKVWRSLAVLHYPTNGYLTNRIVDLTNRVRKVFRGRLVVTVSLDGPEHLNDRIRGVAGGFQHQIETFRRLSDIPHVEVVFGFTLSKHNVRSYRATLEACRARLPGLSADRFHLNLAQTSAHYYSNQGAGDLTPSPEDVLATIAEHRIDRRPGRGFERHVRERFLQGLESFVRSGVTPQRCHALRSSCFIDPWGVVFPCISYSRPLGSLRETGMKLGPIWGEQGTRRVQREIWDYECPQCWTACEAVPTLLGNSLVPLGRERKGKRGTSAVGVEAPRVASLATSSTRRES